MNGNTPSNGGRSPDLNRFRDRDDMVERLLQLADDGPAIPAGGADSVKRAVRPLWQHEVQARRRRSWAWQAAIAAAATLAVTFGLWQWIGDEGPVHNGPIASLLRVVGEVEVTPVEGPTQVLTDGEAGAGLHSGSWLSTGSDARASFVLAAGHSLRLDTGSRVRLDSARVLFLDRGAVYVDSGAASADGIEVHTALGVARDIGTQFQVRSQDNGLVVTVRQGRVEMDRDCGTVEIPSGTALRVAADGSSSAAEIRGDGAEWQWILEVAPAFVIEGRRVNDFLDWVASETGRTIRFVDEETELLAAETILHGTVEGLTPDRTAEVVLPSCGLGATTTAGALVVHRLGENDSNG